MKKSSLTTAVLAGLAGVVGFAGSAGAVDLNPDGTGQVLIYPYYTVNAHQQTLISVVNSTDVGKAVKVRFLESYNSQEVLDFNLFLSPYDVWTGGVFALADAGQSGDGAAFGTADNSCTVPSFASLPSVGPLHYKAFSNAVYSLDGGPTGIERTREGYVEMILMADVTGPTLAAITHDATGVPANCASTLLRTTNGTNDDFVANDGDGGLFGSGQIISVGDGTLYSYNADAINGFNYAVNITDSGSLTPNLGDAAGIAGGPPVAHVFQNGTVVDATYSARPIDAVSAVFMANSVMNEWVANSASGQGSDWVVTFPTKWAYVNQSPAVAPFVDPFADPGVSCVQVDVGTNNIFDREEQTPQTTTNDDFSPRPPGIPPKSLCYEVNIISFSNSGSPVSVLGAANPLNLDVDDPNGFAATSGWLKLGLNPTAETHALGASDEGVTFFGLPATGFAATRYINNNAAPGTLANYAGAFHHRVERNISTLQ